MTPLSPSVVQLATLALTEAAFSKKPEAASRDPSSGMMELLLKIGAALATGVYAFFAKKKYATCVQFIVLYMYTPIYVALAPDAAHITFSSSPAPRHGAARSGASQKCGQET